MATIDKCKCNRSPEEFEEIVPHKKIATGHAVDARVLELWSRINPDDAGFSPREPERIAIHDTDLDVCSRPQYFVNLRQNSPEIAAGKASGCLRIMASHFSGII
jgi:hypothetical protein